VARCGRYCLDLRQLGGGWMAELDALLDRTASLAARPRVVEELPGGLTNRNYKVTTPDGTFVARISAAGTDLLAIDRDIEYRNSLAAAAAGAGAPVVEYRPEDHALIIRFIEGRTFGNADVADPVNIPRIAQACRRLHSGERFGNEFDMFDIQRRYLSVVRSQGLRVPTGYDDLAPQFDAARDALAVRASRTVPCNNDLLAANFIDDGDRIWLIDYEYSGNNDPCYDLGDAINELLLDPERAEQLVTEYHGGPNPLELARARLWSLMSKYGWSLWGAIRIGTTGDPEIREWTRALWQRAVAEFDSPEFDSLLEQAAGAA
jgi:thiamine kinase-like enzyme